MRSKPVLWLLLVSALVLLVVYRVRAAEPAQAYLPILTSERTDGLGFEAVPGAMAAHQAALTDLAPVYLRSNFGSQIAPYDTLYQHYLAGGWAEVDQEVEDELSLWHDIGAIPIVIFMYGGSCVAPTTAQLAGYGDFIALAMGRYNLHYVEVWNEPDAVGGFPSLFGCFGDAYAARLKYLLNRVRSQVDDFRRVGVSFQLANNADLTMLATVASSADWLGIHHYAIWCDGVTTEPWPGSLMGKYDLAVANAAGREVWLTEVNLRTPCETGAEHQQAQADYLEWVLGLPIPVKSVLVYYSYPDWQGTGVRDTLAEDALLPGYP